MIKQDTVTEITMLFNEMFISREKQVINIEY